MNRPMKNNDTSFTAKMAVTDSDDKVNEILLRFLMQVLY